jgi:hypothetical protein
VSDLYFCRDAPAVEHVVSEDSAPVMGASGGHTSSPRSIDILGGPPHKVHPERLSRCKAIMFCGEHHSVEIVRQHLEGVERFNRAPALLAPDSAFRRDLMKRVS